MHIQSMKLYNTIHFVFNIYICVCSAQSRFHIEKLLPTIEPAWYFYFTILVYIDSKYTYTGSQKSNLVLLHRLLKVMLESKLISVPF